MQVEIGNIRAAELVQRHYTVMRQLLHRFDGREISTAGDSMLIVFAAPSEAIKFAISAQKSMRQEHEDEPLMPSMRAGVHQGQVVLQMDGSTQKLVDVYGVQVSTTARIMDLGQGNQILMSRAVYDDARTILRKDELPDFAPLDWCNHGLYRFKGVEDAYDVCEVGETGFAPLEPPAAGTKGWPVGEPSGSSWKSNRQPIWIGACLAAAAIIIVGVALMWPRTSDEIADKSSITTREDPLQAITDRIAEIELELSNLRDSMKRSRQFVSSNKNTLRQPRPSLVQNRFS